MQATALHVGCTYFCFSLLNYSCAIIVLSLIGICLTLPFVEVLLWREVEIPILSMGVPGMNVYVYLSMF